MARRSGSPGQGERYAAKGLAWLIHARADRGMETVSAMESWKPRCGTEPPSLLTLTPLGTKDGYSPMTEPRL
ncbi:hypothetical protein MyNCGM683_09590 [Achromobacter xylosoxidans]